MMYLKTKSLVIREPKAEDIEGYHTLLSDELTSYYWSASNSIAQSWVRLDEAMSEINSPNRVRWFLLSKIWEQNDTLEQLDMAL